MLDYVVDLKIYRYIKKNKILIFRINIIRMNFFQSEENKIPRASEMVHSCEIQGGGDLSGKFPHATAITAGYKGHLDRRPS